MKVICANPYAQYVSHKEEIKEAISKVLDKGRYILGEEVNLFESEFAQYIGVKNVIGVGSGTEAIHIALLACGIKKGDEVITVSHTAVATVAAIELTGASVVFADIDKSTYTIDPSLVEPLITAKTKAIISVHIYGQPVDLEPLSALTRKYEIYLIEDCAQSHGALYNEQMVGSIGDIACFSFYPTKNLGAIGDGGAIATNNSELAEKCKHIREYGWVERYHSYIVGLNSRLDELQAAILRVKLRYLENDTEARIKIAKIYQEGLKDAPFILPIVRNNCRHVFHLYVIRSQQRDEVLKHLESNNINALVHYPIPIHLQKAYNGRIGNSATLIETERASREILSLPMYPELNDVEVQYVIDILKKF